MLEERLAAHRNSHLSVQQNPSYKSISHSPSLSCTSDSGSDNAFVNDSDDLYQTPLDAKKLVPSPQPIASDYEVPRSTTYTYLEHERKEAGHDEYDYIDT